jgi:hypothetical protein
MREWHGVCSGVFGKSSSQVAPGRCCWWQRISITCHGMAALDWQHDGIACEQELLPHPMQQAASDAATSLRFYRSILELCQTILGRLKTRVV